MPGSTNNYNLPYPFITESDQPPEDIQALAEAVDNLLTAGQFATLPVWDGSNSIQLTTDTDCASNSTVTLLTQTVTLTRNQTVLLGARAQFANQNASTAGKVGIRILVDSALPDNRFANGWVWADGNTNDASHVGATSRAFVYIDKEPLVLSAGSHTISLIAYRGGEAVTLTAQSSPSANGTNFYPTYLTIIV